jgi:hypothetical protein
MGTDDLIDQTIERIRASAIAELTTTANGNSQEIMTSEEIIKIVDWVLRDATNGLVDLKARRTPRGYSSCTNSQS